MDLRQAVVRDLPQIIDMYKEIIKKMNEDGIQIWDDIYPCGYFEDDIKNNRLYVMTEGTEIAAAFALCESNSGEGFIEWENRSCKALYIDRVGVNVKYRGKGIGSILLTKAGETAKALSAEYLRLFVVDINVPAIGLYRKNGFARANGVYAEVIDEDLVLHEYGYEIRL